MSRSFASRALGALVVLAALGSAGFGCYNPTIKGQFKCNTNYEKPFNCPDGTTCVAGFCVTGGMTDGGPSDRAPDAKMDAKVDVPVDHGPVDMGTPPADVPDLTCTKPVAGCTSDPSKMCDPVCQTGCPAGCHTKCSVNMQGTLTCNVMSTVTRTKMLLESCNLASKGGADQTDDCAPGLVCLTDGCNLPRCYHFCKTDNDCPTSTCTVDAGGGVKVCDVPTMACNPVKAGSTTADGCGTNTDNLACYLSPTVKDRTLCDCPFLAGRVNDACTLSRDCIPGLVCVGQLCRPACHLPGSADCMSGTCNPVNGSAQFGSCSI